MKITEPRTEADFGQYFQLRYEELRKPWNQPAGTERAADDPESIHAMLVDDAGKAAGVCRLSFAGPEEGQLRFMAIRSDLQGKGLGKLLLDYLEEKAREKGAKYMTLQARELAMPFYQRNGYETVEKTYLLFNEIQHFQMRKQL